MKILLSNLVLILFTVFSLISCSDDPTSVGIGLLQQDYIDAKTIDTKDQPISQQSSYFKEVVSLGASSEVLIGKRDNTEVSALMRFVFVIDDSLKQDFLDDNITVNHAYVELVPKYTFTDETAYFDFSVHKITSDWSITGFTSDSLSNLVYDDVDLSSNKNFIDTLYTFDLSNDFISSWIKTAIDTSLGEFYGIYFKPDVNSGKILGFEALTLTSSDAAKLKVVIEKQGSFIDTISAYIYVDVSVVTGDLPPIPDGDIATQASSTIQSRLFFNTDELPKNIAINKADLILTQDIPNSITGSSYNSYLSVLRIKDSTSMELDETNVMTLVKQDSIFTGDITPIVRYWNIYGGNYGVVIRAGTLTEGLELFTIKGSESSLSERPRLKIVYTNKEKL